MYTQCMYRPEVLNSSKVEAEAWLAEVLHCYSEVHTGFSAAGGVKQ